MPLILLTLPSWTTVQDPPALDSTAFVGVNVVPMDREEILKDQTVIVSGDRIRVVGPSTEVEVPPSATRIDGTGRYLIPGLADMHVHLWYEDHLELLLANGVTTVRNMWGASRHLAWRAEIAAGTRTAPTIYTTGPLLDGPNPSWPGSTVIETAEQAVEEVRRQAAAGYDAVKVYDLLPREAYDAIVATANDVGLPVWGHVPRAVGIGHVLRAGQASIEHLGGYFTASLADGSPIEPDWEELPFGKMVSLLGDVGWQVEAGRLDIDDVVHRSRVVHIAEATAEAGTWNVPTLVVFRSHYTHPSEIRRELEERPEMRYLDSSIRKQWAPPPGDPPTDMPFSLRPWQEERLRIVGALHDAGARILLGTDFANPLVIPGFSIHEELRNLVDCGLTPYEALKAGTVDAAEFLGDSEQWGVVAAGRRADLVLLEANPLEDIARTAEPLGVMVRGRWLPEKELQARLDGIAERLFFRDEFVEAVLAGDLKSAWAVREASAKATAGENPIGETELNSAGYALLGKGEVAAAIEVFELNAREHPASANVWDSLAEAYVIDGQIERAIQNYERSLELDPNNGNARRKLEELRDETSPERARQE